MPKTNMPQGLRIDEHGVTELWCCLCQGNEPEHGTCPGYSYIIRKIAPHTHKSHLPCTVCLVNHSQGRSRSVSSSLFLLVLLAEEDFADAWECLLENEVDAVKQCVRYDDLASVGVHDNSAVLSALFRFKEHSLTNAKLASVLLERRFLHNGGILLLALLKHALNEVLLALAHFEFDFFLDEANHPLHNHAFDGLSVLVGVGGQLSLNAVLDVAADSLELLRADCQLLQACLVVLLRKNDLGVDIELVNLFVVFARVLGLVLAHEGVALVFEETLAQNLVLKSLFVGLLAHHALKFKSVCVVLLNLHFILILIKSLPDQDEQIARSKQAEQSEISELRDGVYLRPC